MASERRKKHEHKQWLESVMYDSFDKKGQDRFLNHHVLTAVYFSTNISFLFKQ
jgi:hypothetical protein